MFESYDLKNFGAKLRDIRNALGYTQKDVEKNTGVHSDTLRRIERGLVLVRFETLMYLSHFYKIDLLNLLRKYSGSNKVLEYYDELDKIIMNYDYNKLTNLFKDFKEFMSTNKDKPNLINLNTIKQFKYVIEGISQLNNEGDQQLTIKTFLDAIKISIPLFSLNNLHNFKYNFFEIRILILLSVALKGNKYHELSNKILKFTLSCLNYDREASYNEKILIIKTHFNISYNYHNLDKFNEALEYANKGIDYCREQNMMYGLNHLFYRKGIAEFLLNKKGYKDSLYKSIQILEIQGNFKLANLYRKITKDNYDIDIH